MSLGLNPVSSQRIDHLPLDILSCVGEYIPENDLKAFSRVCKLFMEASNPLNLDSKTNRTLRFIADLKPYVRFIPRPHTQSKIYVQDTNQDFVLFTQDILSSVLYVLQKQNNKVLQINLENIPERIVTQEKPQLLYAEFLSKRLIRTSTQQTCAVWSIDKDRVTYRAGLDALDGQQLDVGNIGFQKAFKQVNTGIGICETPVWKTASLPGICAVTIKENIHLMSAVHSYKLTLDHSIEIIKQEPNSLEPVSMRKQLYVRRFDGWNECLRSINNVNEKWIVVGQSFYNLERGGHVYYTILNERDQNEEWVLEYPLWNTQKSFEDYVTKPHTWLCKNFFCVATQLNLDIYHVPNRRKVVTIDLNTLLSTIEQKQTITVHVLSVEIRAEKFEVLYQKSNESSLRLARYDLNDIDLKSYEKVKKPKNDSLIKRICSSLFPCLYKA